MSRFGSVSALTVGAVLACAAFAVTVGAAFAGMDPATATRLSSISGATAALLSATCAVRSVASIWRGPRILSFGRDDAVLCPPDAAHATRNAAQIRGTMGGAGWVYRWRRLLPAIGWAAAVGGLLRHELGADALARPRHLAFGPALEHARAIGADLRVADHLLDAGQQRVEAAAEGIRIFTTVVDDANDAPIGNALVMVLKPGIAKAQIDTNRLDDQVIAWGRTNAEGEVRLKVVTVDASRRFLVRLAGVSDRSTLYCHGPARGIGKADPLLYFCTLRKGQQSCCSFAEPDGPHVAQSISGR